MMMMSGIVLRVATAIYLLSAAALGTAATYDGGYNAHAPSSKSPGNNNYHGGDGEQGLTPAILIALKEGTAGEKSLLAWSSWAGGIASRHRTPPRMWVICTDTTHADSVLQKPHLDPFFVSEESSWAAVLVTFLSKNPRISGVGLLGEGAMPHPDLIDSMESMQPSLLEALPPTAILTRSRSKGGDFPGEEERWLPDNFVAQLWCNRAALDASMLKTAGLEKPTPLNTTLLQVLPRLIRDSIEKRLVLVDGTHIIGAIFDAPTTTASGSGGGAKYPSKLSQRLKDPQTVGADVYIGSLDFALVYDGGDDTGRSDLWEEDGSQAATVKTSSIVKAPWPPVYVLETVAMNTSAVSSKGLVLVSSVNCGYLDMATNFLLSVRSTSGAKVSLCGT